MVLRVDCHSGSAFLRERGPEFDGGQRIRSRRGIAVSDLAARSMGPRYLFAVGGDCECRASQNRFWLLAVVQAAAKLHGNSPAFSRFFAAEHSQLIPLAAAIDDLHPHSGARTNRCRFSEAANRHPALGPGRTVALRVE